MKIYVSEKNIELGKKTPCSNTLCPIARALKQAGIKNPRVFMDKAIIKGRVIPLPKTAEKFLWRLCDNRPLKPFSFDFKVEEA